MIKHNPID